MQTKTEDECRELSLELKIPMEDVSDALGIKPDTTYIDSMNNLEELWKTVHRSMKGGFREQKALRRIFKIAKSTVDVKMVNIGSPLISIGLKANHDLIRKQMIADHSPDNLRRLLHDALPGTNIRKQIVTELIELLE